MKNNKNQKRGNQSQNQNPNANQFPGTRQDAQLEQRGTAYRKNDQ